MESCLGSESDGSFCWAEPTGSLKRVGTPITRRDKPPLKELTTASLRHMWLSCVWYRRLLCVWVCACDVSVRIRYWIWPMDQNHLNANVFLLLVTDVSWTTIVSALIRAWIILRLYLCVKSCVVGGCRSCLTDTFIHGDPQVIHVQEDGVGRWGPFSAESRM